MEPLVSIIVVTYNSSKYVFETLESAKAQKYQNIELIVTDDCSSDETVDICKRWIENNNRRFVRTELITNVLNSGIPTNLNRGIKISKGDWIKSIAGDDLLAEDCITELIHFIFTFQGDVQILSSNYIKFSCKSIRNGEIVRNWNTWFCSKECSAHDQYQMLLRENRIFASTVIYNRDLLKMVNGFDERFRLLEDWPFWVKITGLGYKIYHLDKALVYYRFHENSLSHGFIDPNTIYPELSKITYSFKKKELLHRLPYIERLGLRHELIGMKICFVLGNNKRNPFAWFVNFIFRITNPFSLYKHLLKLLSLEYRNIKYFDGTCKQ